MPAYTTKKFCVFVLSSVTMGIIIISLAGYGIQSLLPRVPVGTTYYQLMDGNQTVMGRPMTIWAPTNHTIIILEDNVVESLFKVTAKQNPVVHNITIGVGFDDKYKDILTPQVIEGNLSWSGIWNQDIHINDTITIRTKLRFNLDGWYLVAGYVMISSATQSGGYDTSYYFQVELGRIVKVTEDWGQVPPRSIQGEAIKLP